MLPSHRRLLSTLLLAASPLASASPATAPDLAALVQCQSALEDYAALVVPVDDPLAAVALGWAPLPRSNPFMAEYRLNTAVAAFGQHSDWLAISGGTVMLLLDAGSTAPQDLARQLELEVLVDEDGKFMAGREIRSVDVVDDDSGQILIESAVLGVSTVTSHPGKLLVGCTYSLDQPEVEPEATAPAPAEPSS